MSIVSRDKDQKKAAGVIARRGIWEKLKSSGTTKADIISRLGTRVVPGSTTSDAFPREPAGERGERARSAIAKRQKQIAASECVGRAAG